MKIQYCSDLHIEYTNSVKINPFDYIKPVGDILILQILVHFIYITII